MQRNITAEIQPEHQEFTTIRIQALLMASLLIFNSIAFMPIALTYILFSPSVTTLISTPLLYIIETGLIFNYILTAVLPFILSKFVLNLKNTHELLLFKRTANQLILPISIIAHILIEYLSSFSGFAHHKLGFADLTIDLLLNQEYFAKFMQLLLPPKFMQLLLPLEFLSNFSRRCYTTLNAEQADALNAANFNKKTTAATEQEIHARFNFIFAIFKQIEIVNNIYRKICATNPAITRNLNITPKLKEQIKQLQITCLSNVSLLDLALQYNKTAEEIAILVRNGCELNIKANATQPETLPESFLQKLERTDTIKYQELKRILSTKLITEQQAPWDQYAINAFHRKISHISAATSVQQQYTTAAAAEQATAPLTLHHQQSKHPKVTRAAH